MKKLLVLSSLVICVLWAGYVFASGGASSGLLNTVSVVISQTLSIGSSSVTAAGSSKTDCTAVTTEFVNVSSASALQGVCLLPASVGLKHEIRNSTAVAIYVYPLDSSDDNFRISGFGALSTDAPWLLPPDGEIDCVASSTTAFRCQTSSLSSRATVAAAGTNQATGTALTSVNINAGVTVTGANGTKAITLPTGSDIGCINIMSQTTGATNVLNVYGHNSDNDTINGAAADAVYVQMAGTSLTYCTTNGVAWFTY